MGWWIFKRGLKKDAGQRKCVVCGSLGKTSCLPFLGSKRFCVVCAAAIMRS